MKGAKIKIADVAALGLVGDVTRLINAGYNFDEANDYGDYPITIAASRNDLKVLKVLVEAGADLTVAGEDGRTALQWAEFHQNAEMQELIQSNIQTKKKTNRP